MSKINRELFDKFATRGDLAEVTLDVMVAIRLLTDCLLDMDRKAPLDTEKLAELKALRDSLNRQFEYLVGWDKGADT